MHVFILGPEEDLHLLRPTDDRRLAQLLTEYLQKVPALLDKHLLLIARRLLRRDRRNHQARVTSLKLIVEGVELGEAPHHVNIAEAVRARDLVDGELAHAAAFLLDAYDLEVHVAAVALVIADDGAGSRGNHAVDFMCGGLKFLVLAN